MLNDPLKFWVSPDGMRCVTSLDFSSSAFSILRFNCRVSLCSLKQELTGESIMQASVLG